MSSSEEAALCQVVAGTYERLLYGWDILPSQPDSKYPYEFHPTFIYPSHLSCIKALATMGKYLASGSTDEHIKLYDLKSKKELGSLILQHEGSITSLCFYSPSHLFSASEDGTIAVYRTSDWERLKTLTGHKGAVLGMDVHPSGKLALSVGKDRTLKCWDLTRGLCARSSKVDGDGRNPAEAVYFVPSGSHYLLQYRQCIQIVNVSEAKTETTFKTQSKINTVKPFEYQHVCYFMVGLENGHVMIVTVEGEVMSEVDTQSNSRVRQVDVWQQSDKTYAVSCSSNGIIQLWDMEHMLHKETVASPLAYYDTKCRVTCIQMCPAFASIQPTSTTVANYASEVESEVEELPTRHARVVVSMGDGKKMRKKRKLTTK